MTDHAVIWHDLECHAYAEDLALWHELAAPAGGPVLEVGAGTGRVALDLAAAGHEVVALDNDPALLAALRARADRRGLTVATVCADAADIELRDLAAILVPMQTVQLLDDRAGFLAAALHALRPNGVLAMAIAEDIEPFAGEADAAWLPDPDVGSRDGWEFASHPTAIRVTPGAVVIERTRSATSPDGATTSTESSAVLHPLTAAQLESEALATGFVADRNRRAVPMTALHVGSTVVIVHAP